jgi:hypothetical protein
MSIWFIGMAVIAALFAAFTVALIVYAFRALRQLPPKRRRHGDERGRAWDTSHHISTLGSGGF